MEQSTVNHLFTSINTFEEFELLKQKTEVLEYLAQKIINKHKLEDASLTLFSEGTNIVFAYGEHQVIKIFPPFHQDQFESELLVLNQLEGKLSIKTPSVAYTGEISGWPYIVMSKIEGTLLETLWETMEHHNKVVIMRELGALIREVHYLPTEGLEAIDCHWQQFIENQIDHCVVQHQSKGLSELLIQQIPSYLELLKESLPQITKPVLLTGEYTPMNFLVKQVNGIWHIDGLIDFGDAMLGRAEYDLLGPGAFLIQGDKLLLREFLMAYGYLQHELTEQLSNQLTALMLLHKYSNLNIQVRIQNWKNKVRNLNDLERLVWGF
jgi:hygromycin-B 7''-O-kinase